MLTTLRLAGRLGRRRTLARLVGFLGLLPDRSWRLGIFALVSSLHRVTSLYLTGECDRRATSAPSRSPPVADALQLSECWKEDVMNKDELKGKVEKAKGYVKEEVGEAIGDRDMEERGREQRNLGKAQEKFGEARRKVGDAVKEAGEKISGD
jgi:uncharacterized protein YjbJ (UPF0337 family)